MFKVCPFFYAEAEEAFYCHLVVIFQKPDHSVTLGLKKGCKNCRHCKIIKHFRFITFIDFNVSQINKSTVNFKIKYNLKVSIEKKKINISPWWFFSSIIALFKSFNTCNLRIGLV